jgi:transposase
MHDNSFIGLDVHKATLSIAIAQGARGGEVRRYGTSSHRPDHVRKLVERLCLDGRRLHFCYEAGPCGYGLFRQLSEMGHDCIVMAPSLMPVKAGDRMKTDRRDALMLAKLHRAGELTAVWVPDAAHEAMRDLIRAGYGGACRWQGASASLTGRWNSFRAGALFRDQGWGV